ncbi:hypothetical protein KX928_02410 [Roseobacter sp. YSTF-M11]|uniref:Uncharacterized protein n=1 Tax=Roseobacter insulae TaxID=2859783 RepID=A0A9X1FT45_9RHOB|nr:hypothetical protein [Roseobacter insulae]MBW4706630.1 hypothetical protein [Roseobacter insulae]
MNQLVVTKSKMQSGVWQGLVTGSGDVAPALSVTHLEQPVDDVTLTAAKEAGGWLLQIPVPAEAITDGVQTILISDTATGDRLGSFTLIAGEALGDDLRAEVDLLRAELDMLKRAFRRHCVETM